MINFKCSNEYILKDITTAFNRILNVMEISSNYYVGTIVEYIKDPDNHIDINILTESQALEDTHNTNKDLISFRAYIIYDITVFYTRYETDESIIWLILHEIAHRIMRTDARTFCIMRMVDQVIANEYAKTHYPDHNSTDEKSFDFGLPLYNQTYFTSLYEKTDFHNALLEEQICNTFATMVIGKDYSRNWWEERRI